MAMTLRLTDDETESLRRAAEADGVSMQEFARKAIAASVDAWARTRDTFLADFAVQNRSLLDRLGQ